MKRILLLLIFSFLLLGCSKYDIDKQIDKAEAEQVANQFYYFLQIKDFDKAENLFLIDSISSIKNRFMLNQLFEKTIYEYGNIRNFELDFWNTVTSDDSLGQYLLKYYVTREYHHTFEKISMLKVNDSIKIIGYQLDRNSY